MTLAHLQLTTALFWLRSILAVESVIVASGDTRILCSGLSPFLFGGTTSWATLTLGRRKGSCPWSLQAPAGDPSSTRGKLRNPTRSSALEGRTATAGYVAGRFFPRSRRFELTLVEDLGGGSRGAQGTFTLPRS